VLKLGNFVQFRCYFPPSHQRGPRVSQFLPKLVLMTESAWKSRFFQVQQQYFYDQLNYYIQELPLDVFKIIDLYSNDGWNRVGARVDLQDSSGTWGIGEVVHVVRSSQLRIHFVGWPPKYDLHMSIDDPSIAHAGTKVSLVSPWSDVSAGLKKIEVEGHLTQFLITLGLSWEQAYRLLEVYGSQRRHDVINVAIVWKEHGISAIPEDCQCLFVSSKDSISHDQIMDQDFNDR
jgi:hypothetical protein